MESWTFLIQQEGDNVWLPLESSGSEVLEGRYRVMARTTQANCLLSVQISHLDLDILPPSRRIHKRQAQTNQKGLVALLPFTLLKPGIWEIHCQEQSNDPSGNETSKQVVHKQTLKLQVLEQEAGADLDGAEFYPQERHDQDLPDLTAHQDSIESVETTPALAQAFPLSLDDDASEMENKATHPNPISEMANIDDVLLESTIEESSPAVNTGDVLQDLITELQHPPAAKPPVQPIDKADAPLPLSHPENALSLGETEPLSSPTSARSAPTTDEQAGVEPTDQEMVGDDAEMQILLNTADQMAAHIIETMNAELHRIQHSAAPDIPAPSIPQTDNASPNPENSVVSPRHVGKPTHAKVANTEAANRDQPSVPDYLLPTPSANSQQQWDEDTLQRLGLTINLARDCYTVVNNQLILTGMLEEAGGSNDKEEKRDQQVPLHPPTSLNLEGLTLGLRVQLILPQSGTCLLEHDAALSLSTLPAPFSVLIAIPKNLKTHVLVGEVILAMATAPTMSSSSTATQSPSRTLETRLNEVLAQQSFTVTVGLGTLLDTIQVQQQAMDKKARTIASTTADTEPILPTSTASVPTTADDSEALKLEKRELQPVGYSPLPPKLTTSPSHNKHQHQPVPPQSNGSETPSQPTLDLPHFLRSDSDRPPSSMAIAITQSIQTATDSESPSEENVEVLNTPNHQSASQDDPSIESFEELEDPDQDLGQDSPLTEQTLELDNTLADQPVTAQIDLPPPSPTIDRLEIPPPSPITAEESEARSIQSSAPTQESDIATNLPVVSDLNLSENPFGILLDDVTEPNEWTPEIDEPQPSQPEQHEWTTDIDTLHLSQPDTGKTEEPEDVEENALDEQAFEEHRLEKQPLEQASVGGTTVCPPLPNDMPIPTPTLLVPQTDLIAGTPVRISVTLPSSIMPPDITDSELSQPPRHQTPVSLIFVKLWVQDRQTRSILDGPRWLVDFIPNHEGQLEAMTQLVLPLGCLEVSVEAIAVEMATQRESHKTTIHRSILPTAMPSPLATFNFDDFN